MNKGSTKFRCDSPALICVILLFLVFFVKVKPAFSNPELNFTIATNKLEYGLGENVYISGNLTNEGLPVGDALVAVEVRDSMYNPFVFRTRPTGPMTTGNWLVNFTSLFSCDSIGNPKSTFIRGSTLHISFTIKNFDLTWSHGVIVCLTLYDPVSVPLGAWYPYVTILEPNESKTVVFLADMIPSSAALGTATIYANAYTEFPKDNGYPYCPEKPATFNITGTGSTPPTEPPTSSTNGTYDLSFKIPRPEALFGNYAVYASCYYDGVLTALSTGFKVLLIGDINGDGAVDILDAIQLGNAFNSKPGDPNWNSKADLNHDNEVNILDAIMFGNHFGEEANKPP